MESMTAIMRIVAQQRQNMDIANGLFIHKLRLYLYLRQSE